MDGPAGTTNLKSIPLSLNMANVLGMLKAGNSPATLGLTSTNPSLLTAYGSPKKTPRVMKRFFGITIVLP